MDEFQAILKARQFVRKAAITSVPVDIESLAAIANAKIKVTYDLNHDESGQTFPLGDKHVIMVNGDHREERQRFTILHEIAHIVLELPSQHHGQKITTTNLMRYGGRPSEEMLCDVFAAECLLPHEIFKDDVNDIDISMDAVRELAQKYKASLIATGSRFAFNANDVCAFVLSEGGYIRYVSRSKYLRDKNGWIDFNIPVPKSSVAQRLIQEALETENHDEIQTNIWFNDDFRYHAVLTEASILLKEWDQCLTLLWFDNSVNTKHESFDLDEDDEPLLRELDGILPWPTKKRRK